MIQTQTYLNVTDNSGARKLMCIQVLGTSNWIKKLKPYMRPLGVAQIAGIAFRVGSSYKDV